MKNYRFKFPWVRLCGWAWSVFGKEIIGQLILISWNYQSIYIRVRFTYGNFSCYRGSFLEIQQKPNLFRKDPLFLERVYYFKMFRVRLIWDLKKITFLEFPWNLLSSLVNSIPSLFLFLALNQKIDYQASLRNGRYSKLYRSARCRIISEKNLIILRRTFLQMLTLFEKMINGVVVVTDRIHNNLPL